MIDVLHKLRITESAFTLPSGGMIMDDSLINRLRTYFYGDRDHDVYSLNAHIVRLIILPLLNNFRPPYNPNETRNIN